MTPAQYRALQNRLNRRGAVQMLAILNQVRDPDPDEVWRRLAQALFGVLAPQRAASQELALAYYASLAPAKTAPQVPPLPYTSADTRQAADRFRQRWLSAETPQAASSARTQLAASMVRHGEQAGRETVLQAARLDGARWARTDPKPPVCAFCLILISRGPVYLSDSVRSGGFLAHDHCTCVPVPVFSNDWDGREQYEAAEAFYIEHAAGSGQQLRSLRSAVAEVGSPL